MNLEMTPEQRNSVDELAEDFHSVSPRPARDGTHSVIVRCYGTSMPELCSVCGCEDVDHLDGDGLGHTYRPAWPCATFRVQPSGRRFDITPPHQFMPIPGMSHIKERDSA